MESFILSLRAIGTHLAMRLYIPVAIGTTIVILLLFAGVVWLTTFSAWWWLLFIPTVALCSLLGAIEIVLFVLIRRVRPGQTKEQKQAVQRFVDKIQRTAEIVGTPKAVILFRVVRSAASPSKDPYLADLVSSKELVGDFRELQRMFSPAGVVE